jgi:hypothetical protein
MLMRRIGRAGSMVSLCLISATAWAQINLVHTTPCGQQAFPSACTVPSVGSSNLIVIGWQMGGGANTSTAITSVSDNVGNVYMEAGPARSIDSSAGSSADIWYATSSKAGATSITISTNAAVPNGAAVIWEFSGASSSPLDQTAVLNNQVSTATASGAAVTTTTSGVIISLGIVASNATGLTSGNPFVSDSILKDNGWAHLITTTAGTYSAQWTLDVAGTYASSTASFKAASAAISPCDLNQDGVVNLTDVQLSVNMTLGLVPCTANIGGAGVCNIAVIQRVVNAALGGACVTGGGTVPHYVSLTWNASASSSVAGYNIYRGTSSGGPYSTRVNSSLVSGTAFTDATVVAGRTYYYVCTTVDTSNNESPYSSLASATIPSP